MDITLAIFLLVYVAMGFGHLPDSKVDRTGAAIIGAMLLIAAGKITPAAAWSAIDYSTVGLLFGLMVVSSAFVVSGFYAWAARSVGALDVGPLTLLAIFVAVAGLLSAILTNDVVVVAMTPFLVSLTIARGLNPVPFLLGFCFAANVGSAATIIGSPQNMIAAQALHVSFNGFMRAALVPAVLALPIVWLVIALLYRHRWKLPAPAASTTVAPQAAIPFDRFETLKTALVTLGVVAAFVLTSWPHEVVAMAGASLLLLNRRFASADMLKHVDGNLLLLLIGLFVINAALAGTGLPQRLLGDLRGLGFDLHAPLALLAVVAVLSDAVGNNPAVMLLAPFLDGGQNSEALAAALALGSGFASNIVIFGSLAGIIVVEQARAQGITIGFAEFSRAGLPVTALCLALAAGWIALYAG